MRLTSCYNSQIPQQSSIGRLSISENGLRLLLSSINASPAILDVFHCFGRRDDHDANPVPCYQELSRSDVQLKGEQHFSPKVTIE